MTTSRPFSPMQSNIEQAVSLLQDYPFQGDEQLTRLLCSMEFERDAAWELVVFVPIAYLRTLLRHSGVAFPETYLVRNRAGECWSLPYAEQPVFQAALRFAEEHLARGMAQEHIEALIHRSREFEEVNGSLREGTRPQDIVVSPPEIEADEGQGEGQLEEATEDPSQEFSTRWWEFWK